MKNENKRLEEIFPLCQFARKCIESNYGSENFCITDPENCDQYSNFEYEIVKKEMSKNLDTGIIL